MKTALEIARSNFYCALDQVEEHGSLAAALESYGQNAVDTAREEGVSAEDAHTCFWALAEAHQQVQDAQLLATVIEYASAANLIDGDERKRLFAIQTKFLETF